MTEMPPVPCPDCLAPTEYTGDVFRCPKDGQVFSTPFGMDMSMAQELWSAWTADRVVLELPTPIQQNERGATWAVIVDGNQTEFASGLHWDDNSPIVETDFAMWCPGELRAYCLAGLAASGHALRLTSESTGAGESGE